MNLAEMRRIARPLSFKDRLARHDHDNPSLSDDLQFLSELEGPWKPRMREIEASGTPTMIAGGLMGLVLNPNVVNLTTVTGSATEQALIPTTLMPIQQNAQSGQLYLCYASGTSTTAATPGTYTFAGRIGPSPTNASTGIFGATSGAFTPVASATAAQWQIAGFVLIRGGGSSCNAVGSFEWEHSGTVGGGGPTLSTSAGVFGGITAATFDCTGTAVSTWIGVTHATSTTNTWVPQLFAWASAN